ncbi:hypothetical protein K504DRAFT_516685 [Pleomassaria siparia CBS 279.74]|uniref:Uncharacterized protein n=1 Tax=Pleomassaria siparia CBS 279.74 TaxID=1314801 RepID=A0A6G1KJW1_9PLEO|nr:hypothetical protein K504DRAFT_516685 [Pleomassaria siparia CBS 279.74]
MDTMPDRRKQGGSSHKDTSTVVPDREHRPAESSRRPQGAREQPPSKPTQRQKEREEHKFERPTQRPQGPREQPPSKPTQRQKEREEHKFERPTQRPQGPREQPPSKPTQRQKEREEHKFERPTQRPQGPREQPPSKPTQRQKERQERERERLDQGPLMGPQNPHREPGQASHQPAEVVFQTDQIVPGSPLARMLEDNDGELTAGHGPYRRDAVQAMELQIRTREHAYPAHNSASAAPQSGGNDCGDSCFCCRKN